MSTHSFVYITMIVVIYMGSITPLFAAEGSDGTHLLTRLSNPVDSADAQSALLKLRRKLSGDPPELAGALRSALCSKLSVENKPKVIHRLCLLLAMTPSDDAISLLLDRHDSTVPAETQIVVCRALQVLTSQHLPHDLNTVDRALTHLEKVVRSKNYPQRVVEAALIAAGRFRQKGFDLLMRLRSDPEVSVHVADILPVALWETGDPRALPVFRATIADTKTRPGMRIQAVHLIGWTFAAAVKRGTLVTASEQDACANLLERYLGDDTPDQLFAAALRSLGRIKPVGLEADLREIVFRAMLSENEHRRKAAITTLYQRNIPLSEDERAQIHSAVESDPSPVVRDIARAVLAKHEVMTSP